MRGMNIVDAAAKIGKLETQNHELRFEVEKLRNENDQLKATKQVILQ